MIIAVPKEVKDHETRGGLVPSGVTALREAGHDMLVQSKAGERGSRAHCRIWATRLPAARLLTFWNDTASSRRRNGAGRRPGGISGEALGIDCGDGFLTVEVWTRKG